MMACTSPAPTRRVTPRRISFPSTVAWRSVISSSGLANGPLQADAQQVLRLHRELHRQLLEDFLAEAVDDHRDRVLGGEAPLLAVEDLSSPIFDVDASCSMIAVLLRTSI